MKWMAAEFEESPRFADRFHGQQPVPVVVTRPG